MKEIKKNILHTSRTLFNQLGAANVSMRQIAKELNISHSNLIYHYPSKQVIIQALHSELLSRAIALNAQVKLSSNFIKDLFESSEKGFAILYDYRFLMLELNHILKEDNVLKANFKQVEAIRTSMYQDAIESAIQSGYLRKSEYSEEYIELVEYIRIFSDFWISSSNIYDAESPKVIISKYAYMLVKIFYPYMTSKGKEAFRKLY